MPTSSRSAHASIRGYLYQTVLAAQAWVTLAEGETLVVEGDEDFDVILGGGDVNGEGAQTSVQAKHRSDTVVSLATPSLQRAVAAFARIFAEKDGAVRFVYVTTQSRKAPEHGVDFVDLWVQRERLEGGKRLREVAAALADLAGQDGAQKKGWKDPLPQDDPAWLAFVQSVRFEFDRGGVDAARRKLGELLEHDERCADLAGAGFLPYRILDALWDASSQDDEGLRRLTRHDLGALIEESKGRLVDWSRTEPAKRLVSWVDTAIALEKVLPTFTRPLTHPDLPSQLLDARYEVVPFLSIARAEEIENLSRWCDEGPPVAVKVIVGSGGTGKTRLLLELCKRCRAAGWHAGFLDLDATREQVETLGDGRGDRLVVVDYAETRLDVTRAVLKAVESQTERCRVVLLAREDGPWLESLRTGDAVLGQLVLGEAQRLPPLAPEPGEARAEAFGKMVQAFATARGVAVPDPLPIVHLDRKEMDSALVLAMAALEATRDPDDGEIRPERLLQTTLEHEQRFWERWLKDNGIQRVRERHVEAVEEAVSAVTLLGRWKTQVDAEDCLARVFGLRRSDPELDLPLLVDLAGEFYRGRPGEFVTALQPDLLGEHLVAKVLFRLSDPGAWLETTLHGADSEQRTQAFTVLGRVGADLGDAEGRIRLEGWLGRVLDAEFEESARPAFQAAVGLGRRTAFAPVAKALAEAMGRRSADTCQELAAEILRELDRTNITPVSLRELAVVCGKLRVVALNADDEADPEDLAKHLNNLGIRQSELGQREAALASTGEAEEIYRQLAEDRPDAFLPDLAMSLNNLGIRHSALGRRGEARDATREAVEIYRQLAEDRPDAFLPDLAMSLNNLGNRHSALGRREEARDATREAVEIYRPLAEERPDAFLPDLARALNNLGNRHSALGRREEARDATREAVEIYRPLAEDRPDAFLPDLAMSLNNLGIRHSALGRREEARDATREAVEIRRQLAEDRPDAFLPDLASALNNLGAMHSALGRREEARDATREAVEIRRQLAEDRPDAFLPDLAMSLNNLGNRHSALGRREEARDATREAVEIYRPLAEDRPDAFLPDLASALNNLGSDQSALGRREEARDATREAVEIRRQLAEDRPDAFLPDLAMSLNNFGLRQSALEQHGAALESTREAVEIYRALAEDRPDAFRHHLARSLYARGLALRAARDDEEAAVSFLKGLELILPLAARLPEAFRDLTLALAKDYPQTQDPDEDLLRQVQDIYGNDGDDAI